MTMQNTRTVELLQLRTLYIRYILFYLYLLYLLPGKSDEETLEELSSRATSRMVSGTSHRAPTAMGQQMDSTMPGVV